MKIEIFVDEEATDLKISVTCKQLSPDIEKILATLRMMNHQLTAKKDAEIYLLDIAEVIYTFYKSVCGNVHRNGAINKYGSYHSGRERKEYASCIDDVKYSTA